jgi:CRISPR-associated endoribonuclease Cas6
MRLIVELQSVNNTSIRLPLEYNHLVQAAIYRTLDAELATFLHDYGFEGSGRRFKLFTFSRLFGKFQIMNRQIVFFPPVRLIISSPVEAFCQSLVNGLLSYDGIQLGNEGLIVAAVRAEQPKVAASTIKFRLLSPVVAYSTLFRPDESKYTCYYQPGDGEFTRSAAENIRRKYLASYNVPPPDGELEIRPLQQPKLHVMRFKGTVIKGYTGLLRLAGPEELLQMAVDVGLGSKNSMGFGCGEMVG